MMLRTMLKPMLKITIKYTPLLFASAFSLSLLACSTNTQITTQTDSNLSAKKTEQQSTITYSNLADKATQDFIKDTLQKYQIPQDNIDNYFYYVDYFNKAVANEGLIKQGFQPLAPTANNDDYPDYLAKLEKHNPDFMGTNCRISSFTLLNNLIEVKNPLSTQKTSSMLTFDKSAIDNFPKKIFSDAEQEKFYTLFGGIKTPLTKDKNVHLKNIKAYWTKHGIAMNSPKGMSMIALIVHDDIDNVLFIGHVGVLLENKGKYIFLEKLSFDLPYQALIFSNKSQLKDYLMHKYGKFTAPNTAKPFLIENGEVFVD